MLNDPGKRDMIELRFDRDTWNRVIRFFAAIHEEAQRMKQHFFKLERQLDDRVSGVETIGDESHDILELLRSAAQDKHPAPPTINAGPGPSGNCSEARNLVIRRRPDKFFDVYIDLAEKPFALQQQMGLFLEFIAGGEPGGPDGLVAYRSEDDLLKFLKEINSRTKDPHKYIGNLVNDLKKELDLAKFSRDLVQRNSQGVRFAWRKRGATAPGRLL
jgi:hypothetical protein